MVDIFSCSCPAQKADVDTSDIFDSILQRLWYPVFGAVIPVLGCNLGDTPVWPKRTTDIY